MAEPPVGSPGPEQPWSAFPPPPPQQPPLQPGFASAPTPGYGAPPLASLGRRFGGALLEGLLILVTLVIGWIIWSLISWSAGQTPAKQLLGMRVYKYATVRPATWADMFVREFLVSGVLIGIISTFTFGLGGLIATLLIFGGTLRQTGWDRICGTVVVQEA